MRTTHVFIGTAIAVMLAIAAALFTPALAQAPDSRQNFITSQTAVQLTATLVAPLRPNRLTATVKTITGAQQIFCGPTSGVTVGNGYLIEAIVGTYIEIDTRSEVWCITTTAPQTVSVMENY